MICLPLKGEPNEPSSEAKASSADQPADELSWSPERIKRIANKGFKRCSLPGKVPDLPPLDQLQMVHLVRYHAHACLVSGKYGSMDEQRLRVRTKRPRTLVEILEQVALEPTRAADKSEGSWEQRRRASQFMASVYAQQSGLSCKNCRDLLKSQWNSASAEVKANAVLLMNHTEHPPSDNRTASCPKTQMHECYGCQLTWQTQWGRGGDELSELFEKKLYIDDLTALCRQCRRLKEAFCHFVAFVTRALVMLGMAFYSCSMELNSDAAQLARIHLHAFVCKRWSDWNTPKFVKAIVKPAQLEYEGMIPHPTPTRINNRANPSKALQGGLYYQVQPKIGSLFTASNLTMWKVRCQITTGTNLQKGKMTDEDAKSEILNSKAVGAERMIRVVDFHVKAQKEIKVRTMSKHVLAILKSKEKKFRREPVVDSWSVQYLDIYSNPEHRYLSLLLRGPSQAGKTAFAVAIFGVEQTFVVNCQGCSPDLPSIEAFDRTRHVAIVWDEIDEQQVLHNKVVFQAPAHVVTLGQSKCNQFSYGQFLHGVAMILCSNTFRYPRADRNTNLDKVDADWIVKNIREVELPNGEFWYERPPKDESEKKKPRVSDAEQPAADLGRVLWEL